MRGQFKVLPLEVPPFGGVGWGLLALSPPFRYIPLEGDLDFLFLVAAIFLGSARYGNDATFLRNQPETESDSEEIQPSTYNEISRHPKRKILERGCRFSCLPPPTFLADWDLAYTLEKEDG